jgi:hypothetical protein
MVPGKTVGGFLDGPYDGGPDLRMRRGKPGYPRETWTVPEALREPLRVCVAVPADVASEAWYWRLDGMTVLVLPLPVYVWVMAHIVLTHPGCTSEGTYGHMGDLRWDPEPALRDLLARGHVRQDDQGRWWPTESAWT